MSVIHTPKGIKNQHKLKESDFLKTPSIIKVDIGNQPSHYEAYLYLITDIPTKRKYLGIHKKSDKLYWTSASDKELLKILQGSEKRIEYKILEYGFLSAIQTKEHKLLLQNNAANSDEWFNKQNGYVYSEDVDFKLINKILKRIKSGEWKSNTKESVKELFENTPTWQIRHEEYLPTLLKELKDILTEAGNNTDNCNPIVILENRLNGKIYDETDLRVDGAHTLKAAYDIGSQEIHTIRIPESIHKLLNNTEVEVLASFLNTKEQIIKEPNSKQTAANFIFNRYLKSNEPYNSDSNIEYLKGCGFQSSSDRKKIMEMANEMIKTYDKETKFNIVLIDYKEADSAVLNKKVKELESDVTLVVAQSSLSLRWDRICEKLQDDTLGRKKAILVVYHSSFAAKAAWDAIEYETLKSRLEYWAQPQGYSFEFVEMPHEREKIMLD
jgi:hypothetical protein